MAASTPKPGLQADLDTRLWAAINLDAPDWWLHPIWKTVFNESDDFQAACAVSPLAFVPGLSEVLESSTPPSIDWFKSLPAAQPDKLRQKWIVYVHVFELEGRKPRLYIGSATDFLHGGRERLRTYEKKTHDSLPRYVRKVYDQGFTKTHSAVLCWSDMPPPGWGARVRQRYLGHEGILQMLFFAAYHNKFEPHWVDSVPWAREDVDWMPLCSHISINEIAKGDFHLPIEVLEEIEAGRLERERGRKARNSLRSDRRHKAANRARHKARVAANKASKRFHCDVCDKSLQSRVALVSHRKSDDHKKQLRIATGEVFTRSAGATRSARDVAANRAAKLYHCDICDHTCNLPQHLVSHYKSNKHKRNAALADAEFLDCDSDSDQDEDPEDVTAAFNYAYMDAVHEAASSV
jgi:hypothetical protein